MIDRKINDKANISWWLLIKSLGCNNCHTGRILAIAAYPNRKYIQKLIGKDIGKLIPIKIDKYSIVNTAIDGIKAFRLVL